MYRLRRQSRDRARLHDVERAIRETPLDVVRLAVVRLNRLTQFHQLGHLRRVQYLRTPLARFDFALLRAGCRGYGHHGFVANRDLLDRSRGFIGDDMIRCHQPTDDGFAQPPSSIYGDLITRSAYWGLSKN